MNWRRLEIKMFIELPCLLVNRMNKDRACSNDVSSVSYPLKCILEERFSLAQYLFPPYRRQVLLAK